MRIVNRTPIDRRLSAIVALTSGASFTVRKFATLISEPTPAPTSAPAPHPRHHGAELRMAAPPDLGAFHRSERAGEEADRSANERATERLPLRRQIAVVHLELGHGRERHRYERRVARAVAYHEGITPHRHEHRRGAAHLEQWCADPHGVARGDNGAVLRRQRACAGRRHRARHAPRTPAGTPHARRVARPRRTGSPCSVHQYVREAPLRPYGLSRNPNPSRPPGSATTLTCGLSHTRSYGSCRMSAPIPAPSAANVPVETSTICPFVVVH